jgi:transcriptional regulator with XRE-family HTH domain
MFRRANDKEYEVLVAENRFVSEVQMAIERALKVRGMSHADLARAAGITDARVSQILADNGTNLRARTVARLANALGMDPVIEFCDRISALTRSAPQPAKNQDAVALWLKSLERKNDWIMPEVAPCNDDVPDRVAVYAD